MSKKVQDFFQNFAAYSEISEVYFSNIFQIIYLYFVWPNIFKASNQLQTKFQEKK